MTEPLFDVEPPEWASADDVDMMWYEDLRKATAITVCHIVNSVHRNFCRAIGVSFSGTTLGKLQGMCLLLAEVHLAGFDDEISSSEVNDQLSRLVKTVGLVDYDVDSGWPMAPDGLLELDDALEIVDRAFRGDYRPA